ncbi:MAG: hypothetical protein HKN16_05210, partial [Saprospiraceae bacterium]|nr:hypothetical protein [Saprospiraceae bacterium]
MKAFVTIQGWIAVFLCFSFLIDNHGPSGQMNDWSTLVSAQEGKLQLDLKIREFPNIGEEEWINLQLNNDYQKTLDITNARMEVRIMAVDQNGKKITEGFFSSEDPSEIFNLPSSISPFDSPQI